MPQNGNAMDWTLLVVMLIALGLLHFFGRKTTYPETLDFSEGPVKFRGDAYQGFLCLFMAGAFIAGSLLISDWRFLIAAIFLIGLFLHFAYFGFSSSITLHPDNTFHFASPFQKVTFNLSDVDKIKASRSALILHLKNGQKIWLSTILEDHENLYGYLFANAEERFSKRAAKRIRKKHRFVEML